MRRSSPIPRATSCTSAPHFSQRSAISLMKVIFVARNALDAYLMSSAERRSVKRIGVSLMKSGRYTSRMTRRARSSSVPTTMRSGCLKSSIAAPSRRNSGFDTTAKSAFRAQFANDRLDVVIGSHRNRRFYGDNGEACDFSGGLGRGVMNIREIGKSIAPPQGRTYRQEYGVGGANRRCRFARKGQAPGCDVAGDERVQPRFENRQFSALKCSDLLCILVDAGYDVAEVRKTCTGDQSDIARTKHCYSHEVEPSAVAISTFPLVADRDLVCLHHVCHERVKGRPVSPTQFGARLARVTNETIDLCRPEIARIHLDQRLARGFVDTLLLDVLAAPHDSSADMG